jgi:hypothetical protein
MVRFVAAGSKRCVLLDRVDVTGIVGTALTKAGSQRTVLLRRVSSRADGSLRESLLVNSGVKLPTAPRGRGPKMLVRFDPIAALAQKRPDDPTAEIVPWTGKDAARAVPEVYQTLLTEPTPTTGTIPQGPLGR